MTNGKVKIIEINRPSLLRNIALEINLFSSPGGGASKEMFKGRLRSYHDADYQEDHVILEESNDMGRVGDFLFDFGYFHRNNNMRIVSMTLTTCYNIII